MGEGWQNCRPAILLLAWDAVPETIAPLSCRRWSEGQLLHQRGEGYNPRQENHIFHSNLLRPLSLTAAHPILIPGRRAKAPGMWSAERARAEEAELAQSSSSPAARWLKRKR